MGKGSKPSAPAYPTTTTNTGLWGSSTTGPSGTTFSPTQFQKQLIGSVESYIPQTLDYMMNPTTDNAYYQAQKNVRQQAQNDAFENQVVNALASRNLSRGSAGQGLINSYADSVARQEDQALADAQGQASALLAQLMGLHAAPYEMMRGTSQLSQAGTNALADYNMKKYQAELQAQANKNAMLGSIGSTIGQLGGAALGGVLGGPVGASVGSTFGSKIGSMYSNPYG